MLTNRNWDEICTAVFEGRMAAREFFDRTSRDWEHFAKYLLRRWRAPDNVERQDIEQELRLGAWKSIFLFDKRRSTRIGRYVVWNALDYAKKELHKLRNAKRSREVDAAPGRFERNFASYEKSSSGFESAHHRHFLVVSVPPDQESAVRALDRAEHAHSRCRTDDERRALRAILETGDLVDAALLLWREEGTGEAMESPAAVGEFTARTAAYVFQEGE